LESIQQASQSRTDLAFETTLSGRSYVRVIRDLRKRGYRMHMFYLWIPGPELALLRVRERVRQGGHNVPAADVRRRFRRTLTNLFTLYRPLLHTLHFFDNSRAEAHLIFKDEDGKTTVFDHPAYQEVLSTVRR
jgi:predicted ABC-type ATPase